MQPTPSISACAANTWSEGDFFKTISSPPAKDTVANVASAEFATVTNLIVVPELNSRTFGAPLKVEAPATLVPQAAWTPNNFKLIYFSI